MVPAHRRRKNSSASVGELEGLKGIFVVVGKRSLRVDVVLHTMRVNRHDVKVSGLCQILPDAVRKISSGTVAIKID